jgi:2-polyprenyl-6-methoxyphenol hydroxylase-like FAD-dependent oxidoreductase
MRADDVRVLIVGAGIAGLAAARALDARGFRVEIIDRLPEAPRHGTGLYLLGNAMRALGALGYGGAVADRAVRIERQRTADHRGRRLFDAETGALWRGVGPCVALPRAELHRVLLEGVGSIPVRWGADLQAIVLEAGTVRVTIDGVEACYDLVIGADGVHSTVRRLVLAGDGVRPVGQRASRFVVPMELDTGTWEVRLGHGSALLTIPIGQGRTYCYVDGPLDGPESLRELLRTYAKPVPSLLDALESLGGEHAVVTGPVDEVVLQSWSRGHTLVIGDAAHATSPNMAQGAAMALEDSIVLAESLQAAPEIGGALSVFERRRRPRTDWVREQTHRRDRARGLPPILRDPLLRTVGARILRANYRPLREPP